MRILLSSSGKLLKVPFLCLYVVVAYPADDDDA
jgi:hypothetical protein